MLRNAGASVLVMLIALVTGIHVSDAEGVSADSGEVMVELRVWQDIDDTESLYVSARTTGGDWDPLGTVALPMGNYGGGYAPQSEYVYGDLAVGGIELRVWQRVNAARTIFVRACSSICREPELHWQRLAWRPLGMISLPLEDGYSPSGQYRYGDLTIAVPRSNAGLQADREHLLALKGPLEGRESTKLNWDIGTPVANWEGVTVEGVPPRVTKLELSERGLSGELWGWVGDLTELTELRLDGNRLSGPLPSKLTRLTKLTALHLGHNSFPGNVNGTLLCVPPPLHAVNDNDVATLGLPDCAPPPRGWTSASSGYGIVGGGTHRTSRFVFDVQPGQWMEVAAQVLEVMFDRSGPVTHILDSDEEGIVLGSICSQLLDRYCPSYWVFLNFEGEELERSRYGPFSETIDRLVASVWAATATDADGWPSH